MSYQAPTQSVETITARYADARRADSIPHLVAERNARCDRDEAEYKADRRLKAVRRYLKERTAR